MLTCINLYTNSHLPHGTFNYLSFMAIPVKTAQHTNPDTLSSRITPSSGHTSSPQQHPRSKDLDLGLDSSTHTHPRVKCCFLASSFEHLPGQDEAWVEGLAHHQVRLSRTDRRHTHLHQVLARVWHLLLPTEGLLGPWDCGLAHQMK